MMAEEKTIRLLRHTRHDWLNRIQIVKGNLELGKPDKALDIIKQIISDTLQETKLSNLQLFLFAEYILTYNWNNLPLLLNFEIKGLPKKVEANDEFLLEHTKKLMDIILSNIDMREENVFTITIDLEEETTRFYYDFSGKLKGVEALSVYFQEHNHVWGNPYYDEEELSVELLYKEK